ncbi:DNA-binding protein [Romeria aff. gracilis LEGE 07310]|uniref:DNA-binding protein n=1 Tax=Vasconcelosia minhoensis LEGE 07310 TaxID=915328 RepID=A0A8J7AWZ6_9CYAN|nr:PPC domain-containing DNA-binding protein [Romeria gracilis]MBE9080394.1 DNA-binding protein [Romeria aff. gracilis LEGE 07310]
MNRFLQPHALRLKPGTELRQALQQFAQARQLQAGCILTAVGSLEQVALRFAGQEQTERFPGPAEIVSLSGTLSVHGLHLHLAVSGPMGETRGGHLVKGCLVYTTAEIVIAELPQLIFKREQCSLSGYQELVIHCSEFQADSDFLSSTPAT